MRLFALFELIVICAFLYLAANLVRYFFFKESAGNKLFGLSDKWIKDENKKEERGGK